MSKLSAVGAAGLVSCFAFGAHSGSLTTTFNAGSGSFGNMFDVEVGGFDVTVHGLDLNLNSGFREVSLYYRTGSYTEAPNDATEWTLLETSLVAGAGSGNPAPWTGLDFNLTANQTYGLFVYSMNGGVFYTTGNGVGEVAAQNDDLTIFEGVGRGPDSDPFASDTFSPRVWNGTIHYTVVPEIDGNGLAYIAFILGALGLWLYSGAGRGRQEETPAVA